ncbi:MAG: hypothetical protein NZ482_01820 [Gloeomargarita sp. SKYG98]|nr:hypothetical protein [Gloeomargarita sp. SKYG98]
MDGLLTLAAVLALAAASPHFWWQRIVNFQDTITQLSYGIQAGAQLGYQLIGEPVLAVAHPHKPDTFPGQIAVPGTYTVLVVGDPTLTAIHAKLLADTTLLAQATNAEMPLTLDFALDKPSNLQLELHAQTCPKPACPLAIAIFKKEKDKDVTPTPGTYPWKSKNN